MIVISTVKSIKKIMPNSKFSIESITPEIDKEIYKSIEIKITRKILRSYIDSSIYLIRCILWRILGIFFSNVDSIINQKKFKYYGSSDVILDLSGDVLSVPIESKNINFKIKRNIISILGHAYLFLIFIIIKKPIIIYAQTIGPIGPLKLLIKTMLNKMTLITVREEESLKYLKKNGITKPPLYLTADPSFLLENPPNLKINKVFKKEKIETNISMVGICLSSETCKYHYNNNDEELEKKFSEFIDYIVNDYNIQVILIPFSKWKSQGGDDRIIASKIWNYCKVKDRVKIIKNDYEPSIIKGIVSRCSVFIGSRGHSMMIALSSCVPTIAIGHNPKYYGIMKMAGQEKFVYKSYYLTYEILLSAFQQIWYNKDNIKNQLVNNIIKIRELAAHNAKLVSDRLTEIKI